MKIHIEEYELEMAAYVGFRRQLQMTKEGIPSRFEKEKRKQGDYDYVDLEVWGSHINAAISEYAVAKGLDVTWDGSVGTFSNKPDVGRYEVRTSTDSKRKEMVIREKDKDEAVFVFITGSYPDYEILGWLTGAEAKQDKWRKNPNNRGWAWFVPASELRKLEEIPIY